MNVTMRGLKPPPTGSRGPYISTHRRGIARHWPFDGWVTIAGAKAPAYSITS
jgi:hypothetical protein